MDKGAKVWACGVGSALVLFLAGCGGASPGGTSAAPTDTASSSVKGDFPLTVENCGVSTTYQQPPKQAVAAFPSIIETVLPLGVESQLVGTSLAGHGLSQTQVKEKYRNVYTSIPVLSGKDLSKEVLLSFSPDFVVGRNSTFDEAKGLSREALKASGINTFVLSEDCVTGPTTWPATYDQIKALGRVFGAADRAEQVVAEMQRDVAAVTEKVKNVSGQPPKVFVYQQGEAAPDTTGQGTLNLAIETAGGRNIFGDNPKFYATVTWEEVVARDPDVIVIVDRAGGEGGAKEPSVAAKREFLKRFPPLAKVSAVGNDKMLSIPLSQVYMSARTSDVMLSIAKAIHPDLFP